MCNPTPEWVPAFAGMTFVNDDWFPIQKTLGYSVIPAKAGTHYDFKFGKRPKPKSSMGPDFRRDDNDF
jgi:hypothetical protein